MKPTQVVAALCAFFSFVRSSPTPAAHEDHSNIEARSLDCKIVTFSVFARAATYNYTSIVPDLDDYELLLGDITNGVYTQSPVEGTNTIVGRYCAPFVTNDKSDTLQLLVHGITSNKEYWTGLTFPGYEAPDYSWMYYMSKLGYPTLAIDRLGNGESSHPNPILTVQVPYEVVLYKNLANQIKRGSSQLPKAFTDIVYVGHSLGSEIGDNIAKVYPDLFSTYILTGFSKNVTESLPGVLLQDAVPAKIHDPSKYGDLQPGYLTAQSEVGHINSFFGTRSGIDYDPKIASLFYTTEDTVSVGQFIGAFTAIVSAPDQEGRILVLTGERDQAFCGPGSPVIGVAYCGDLLKETGALFPKAEYSWHAVPHTGHVVNLHYSRLSAFLVAAQFLDGKTFSG